MDLCRCRLPPSGMSGPVQPGGTGVIAEDGDKSVDKLLIGPVVLQVDDPARHHCWERRHRRTECASASERCADTPVIDCVQLHAAGWTGDYDTATWTAGVWADLFRLR